MRKKSMVDSDAKMTSHGRLKPPSDQVLDYASVPPHDPNRFCRLEGKNKRMPNSQQLKRSCSVVAIFNWFDSASDVVNAFRRGSLLSSSQLHPPKQTNTSNTKRRMKEKTTMGIRLKTRYQMAWFSWIISTQNDS